VNSPTAATMRSNFFAHTMGALAEWLVLWCVAQRKSFSENKTRRRLLVVMVGVLVAIASTYSFSQGSPPGLDALEVPTPPTSGTIGQMPMTSSDIVNLAVNAVDSEIDKLKNSATLQGYGTLISGFFLVALMSWSAVKSLATAKGFGDMIAEWVPIFVSFGFVYLFLNRSAPAMIEGFVSSIGTAISGMPMSGMGPSMRAIADPMMESIFSMLSDNTREPSGLVEHLQWVGVSIINAMTQLLAIFLLVIGLIVSMATVIMAHISIALAMAMAPVMVPFIMFKPTTWIFDSWVKFTVGAAMMKVVFAFMVKIAAAILTGAATMRATLRGDASMGYGDWATSDLLVQALVVLLCLLAMLILMQTPSIATGLVSGSAGGGGFSGLKGFNGGTSGRFAGKALGPDPTPPPKPGKPGPITSSASAAGRGLGAGMSKFKKGGSTP